VTSCTCCQVERSTCLCTASIQPLLKASWLLSQHSLWLELHFSIGRSMPRVHPPCACRAPITATLVGKSSLQIPAVHRRADEACTQDTAANKTGGQECISSVPTVLLIIMAIALKIQQKPMLECLHRSKPVLMAAFLATWRCQLAEPAQAQQKHEHACSACRLRLVL
jgi:hypothetical protein